MNIFSLFVAYWWLALILPLLGWMGWEFIRAETKKHSTALFLNNTNASPRMGLFRMKVGLLLCGVILLLLSAWRPQWGQELQKTEKRGVDVVFAIDVSQSMKALDFSQQQQLISRLDAAKYLAQKFTELRKSDRIGLVEFAGESFVASPLTLDYTVFLSFLKNISSDDLGKQGTNLAEALEVSIARLEIQSEEARGKAIILFSDGDETITGGTKDMAKLAKEKGIKIFTVGVGGDEGMPIPESRDRFGKIIYKQWKGETVITKLNPEPLEEIASLADGEFFHVKNISDIEV